MKNLKLSAASAVLAAASWAAPAHAAGVLDIYVCYACNTTGNAAVDAALTANPSVSYDGLLFAFINTSASAITGASFAVSSAAPDDSYSLGTIPAGATVIVMPGLSSDGGAHPSGGLFAVTGSTVDTSEGVGGVSDTSVWVFNGTQDTAAVTSGTFTAGDAALIRPFRDNPDAGSTSFLGNGPSGDGGCNNCYYAKIASGDVAAVPEPASLPMYGAGLGLLGWALRRRLNTAR
jgi:hypothetical protein